MKQKKKGRIIAVCAAAVLIGAAAAVIFIIMRYFNYNGYQQYLTSYEVEEGGEFRPLEDSSADVPGMVLEAENDELKLYTDQETSEIAVYEKATGHITRSNPEDRDGDAVAAGVNKSLLNSTLDVIYYNSAGNRASMNNYDMSIQYGQFEAQALEKGIRYVYTLEDPSNSTGIIPTQISEERLQTLILDKLGERDARSMKGRFTLRDGIYYLNEDAMNSKVGMQRMNAAFEECGYTEEDYAIDMEGAEGSENISFQVTVDYRLTDNGLAVSIPVNQIREQGEAKITRLRVLPFFGAAGTEAEGYMMVPDGSGALIHLNNGASAAAYMQNVYGIDPVVQSYVVTDLTETVRLPVFGMKNGEQAFLGRITEGDSLGIINADVAGRTNSYNYVFAEFSVREMELLNMFGVSGNKADVPSVERELYDENLTVVYSFLSGEEADYSGMAQCYREQLKAEGTLGSTEAGDIPFYVDILGGVEIQKAVMGVPYDGIVAMTTYEQTGTLLDMIYQAGIGNVRMNYQGWFNGGIYHDAADKVKPVGALGSKAELEALARRLEENGGRLFLDVAFQKVPYTSKRFNDLLEASKYYSGYVVQLGALNPGTMRQTSALSWYDELVYYVISPKFLPWYVEHFADRMEKYDVGGISLRDLGDVIASDKKRTEVISRQDAEEVIKAQFHRLSQTGKQLMERGGNAYTFGYVTDIVDAPTYYSKFYIVDEQIPFYQMVIHGSIDYTGNALNLMDQDVDEELILSWIEYGVSPRYTLSWEDSSQIKYTSAADKYSVNYTTWMDSAQSVYRQMNEALAPVQGAAMVHHEVLENGLAVVEYDNGVTVYVNKTEQELTAEDGTRVDAMSYVTKQNKTARKTGQMQKAAADRGCRETGVESISRNHGEPEAMAGGAA